MGRAKASPTMDTVRGRVRSTVAKSSSASKRRDVRVTTRPPADRTGSDAMIRPVLCINGEAGSATGERPRRCSSSARSTAGPSQSTSGSPSICRPRTRVLATLRPITYSTAFGSPVVPPVQDRKESSGERGTRAAGGCEASRSS